MAGLPAVTYAETTAASGATKITALPATLSTPGTYYLAQEFNVNLSNDSVAIAVTVPGVTIDMNSHTITNTNNVGPDSGACGIHTGYNGNFTLRNGTISGFLRGVVAQGNVNLVENMTFLNNVQGVYLGSGSRLFRCRAILSGGTDTPNACEGLFVSLDSTVEDCDVSGYTGMAGTYGLFVNGEGQNIFIINNRFSGLANGVVGSGYKYRDNLTSGVGADYYGGTDAGNNN